MRPYDDLDQGRGAENQSFSGCILNVSGFLNELDVECERTCTSANEWIRKLWYIYTMEYYLAIKKNAFEFSSNEVDGTGAYYTECSKSERKTPIQYTNAYIWNLER